MREAVVMGKTEGGVVMEKKTICKKCGCNEYGFCVFKNLEILPSWEIYDCNGFENVKKHFHKKEYAKHHLEILIKWVQNREINIDSGCYLPVLSDAMEALKREEILHKIILKISILSQKWNIPTHLKSILGSFNDTLSDKEILEKLELKDYILRLRTTLCRAEKHEQEDEK